MLAQYFPCLVQTISIQRKINNFKSQKLKEVLILNRCERNTFDKFRFLDKCSKMLTIFSEIGTPFK